jgi:glycosyltransferase involved in cell wall biosynthesis
MQPKDFDMKNKILYLFTVLPTANIGAARRTLQMGQLLSRFGPVTFVLVSENDHGLDEIRDAENLMGSIECMRIVRYRHRSPVAMLKQVIDSRSLEASRVKATEDAVRRLDQLLEEHDMVWIHTLKVANAFRRYSWKNSVLDLDDIPSKWFEMVAAKALNPIRRLGLRIDAKLLRRSERHLQERFKVLTLCDPADCRLFRDPKRVHAIPNGFDGETHLKSWLPSGSKRLGMIGVFAYPPNRDGVLWFLKNVWPKIRQIDKFEFVLVGRGGEEIAAAFPDCGVTARGFVKSLSQEVDGWAGMIVPTRIGGGTHVKIAEGMSMGLPIVSTTHGCRGYKVENGKEVIVADGDYAFANACVALLQNSELQDRLSHESRQYFENYLTWNAIAPLVERAILAVQEVGSRGINDSETLNLGVPAVAGIAPKSD